MADALAPTSALAGLAAPRLRLGSVGVRVQEIAGLGLASVTARKGRRNELAGRLLTLHGLKLPSGPRRAAGLAMAFIGVGPDAWLAEASAVPPDWSMRLARDLEGLASVADQSGAYTALRLQGAHAAAVLAKGLAIDLHPTAFPMARAAVSDVEGAPVILWRRADGFDLLVARSYAPDLWRWLCDSGEEFGLEIGASAVAAP